MKKIIVFLLVLFNIVNAENILISKSNLYKLLMKNNFDIQNKKENLKYTNYQIKETKSIVWPTLKLEYNFAKLKSYVVPQIDKDHNYKFSLVQPLFTYGKISTAIDIAEHYYKTSELDYKQIKRKVYLDSLILMYKIKLMEENKKILLFSKKLLEQLLYNTKQKFKAGSVTKLDYLSSQVSYQKIIPKIMDINTNIINLKNELKQKLNYNLKNNLIIKCDLKMKYKEFNKKTLIKKCFDGNEDLKKLRQNKTINNLQKKLSENYLRPSLNFIGSYSGDDETFSRMVKKNDYYLGLNLTFPLFDGFKSKYQEKQFDSKNINLERNLNNLKQNLELYIEFYLNNLKKSLKQISTNKIIIKQAEEAYRISKLNYENGNSIYTEVIDSENKLMESKIELSTSYYNYIYFLLNLKYITNSKI